MNILQGRMNILQGRRKRFYGGGGDWVKISATIVSQRQKIKKKQKTLAKTP